MKKEQTRSARTDTPAASGGTVITVSLDSEIKADTQAGKETENKPKDTSDATKEES